jgi:N-acetylmuramoyl-L-alanine amidase
MILIIAGHGGIDRGAIGIDGTTERDLVTSFAKKIQGKNIKHIGVYEELSLIQKINKANDFSKEDILISIHANSANPKAQGVEVWHHQTDSESKTLAQLVANQISNDTGLKNRGIKNEIKNKHKRLGILHDTKPTSILLELGFISNKRDLYVLKNQQEKIANALIKAMEKYYKIRSQKIFSEIWHEASKIQDKDLTKKIQLLSHKGANNLRN